MNCHKCNAKIPDHAKFCMECGAALNSRLILTLFECPRCKAVVSLDSKFCHKCGINIEELKRTCAECGSPYLFGQRYCSKCKCSLIDESMGLIFNDIGIVYFNLKNSESLIKAEQLFKESKYIDAFKELQKEEKLVQIFILNKKDLNWILDCLEQVAIRNKAYVRQVTALTEQLLSDDESKIFRIALYENLSKQAEDEGDTISAHHHYRVLYRLTKKQEYKKKIESLNNEKQSKKRKSFLFAVLKLIIVGLASAALFDLLFIALFGYKFPLRYSGTNLTDVGELSVWRFIPLFSFIGLSISISYWLVFHGFFSGQKKKRFLISLALTALLFFLAGLCWGEIVNKGDACYIIIFILALLSYGFIQIRGIKDFFHKSWKTKMWPIITPVLLYVAVIPGRMAVPLYNQSAQADFVGLGFFAFTFILLQSIFLFLFSKNGYPIKSKTRSKVLA